MLARRKSSKEGKPLPKDWQESLARLLNEAYKKECEKEARYFDVYGQIYPEELLLVVSWLSEKEQGVAPVTCFLSCEPDQMASEEKVRKTQADFIDLAGLFYDDIFSKADWDNEEISVFEPNWQEVCHKNQNYFYKLSRENINLTIEADKLLGPDFEDVEFEDDED
jgi:hypothetical protein